MRFGCNSQTASLRQESVIFLVEQITQPWAVRVKCYRVKSWFLVNSAEPAETRCCSLSGHSNFRSSQHRCKCLTRGISGCKKRKKANIDCLLVRTCFIDFQALTLEMLLTCASWGVSSHKHAQLITRVWNSNICFFAAPLRPQLPHLPQCLGTTYVITGNCSQRPLLLNIGQICSF